MARTWSRRDLRWQGDELCYGKVVLLEIERDALWPAMWRIQLPGKLSDRMSKARAKDAAVLIALAGLNGQERASEAA